MKKLIFDFCTQVMVAFAYTIVLLNVFCIIFGNGAKGLSTIFSLGSEGIPVCTVFQFLIVSVLINGIRALFVSNFMIDKMSYFLRNMCMLISIFIVIIVCVVLFQWFPLNQKAAWAGFMICYILSFGMSLVVSTVKINIENKRLSDALNDLKNEDLREEQ